MTVQLLRKPSMTYGLGVRSPFADYDLALKRSEGAFDAIGWLECHGLRSELPFERAVLSRMRCVERTIRRDERFVLAGAQMITIAEPARLDIALAGTRIEDFDACVLLLDVRADAELVLESQPEAKSVQLVCVRVAPGAKLRFNDLVIAGHDAFHRTRVALEESASVEPHHAFFTYASAKLDLKSDIAHAGRASLSDMKVRGVLAGSSQAIVQGDVTIKPSAFDANGYQQEDLILASPTAVARPIPNLEIGNSDVKCSHGATVSSLDPEQVFYLMSRGIPESEARTLLLSSFVAPVLDLHDERDLDRIRRAIGRIIDEAR